MNHFERVAIFTLIENIETQLRGVKTLLAASSQTNAPSTHTTTQTIPQDTHDLSEEEEAKLAKEIEAAQKAEVERMRKAAESAFQREWEITANATSRMAD